VTSFKVPSTQKCICYVKKKKLLYSASIDGAIYAWKIDKLFLKTKADGYYDIDDGKKKRKKEVPHEKEYKEFIAERTPWFMGDMILCLTYLPKINFLATGSIDKIIRLWDLRSNSEREEEEQKGTSKNKKLGDRSTKNKKKNDDPYSDLMNDFFVKDTIKELKGHQRAVREISYSVSNKILVSCGFDFEVFVWNPYYEEAIIKLPGHESPLVGVNCLQNMNAFITADSNGVIKVWNINDYSCTQTLTVQNVI
jgi:WD40 repeat protein